LNIIFYATKEIIWTHGACSSVALAGFALPECPGSSSRVYPALEGLAPGLAGCPVSRGE